MRGRLLDSHPTSSSDAVNSLFSMFLASHEVLCHDAIMEQITACERLRQHLGMSVLKFAAETDISLPTTYQMIHGRGCGGKTWLKVKRRWGPQIEELGLIDEDFIERKVEDAE